MLQNFFKGFLNHSQRAQTETNDNELNNLVSLLTALYSPQAIMQEYSLEYAVRKAYTASIWVYRCVNLIAQSITSAYVQIKNSKDEPIDNHPLLKVLEMPNPEMPPKDVWQSVWINAELAGNAYLLKAKLGSRTRELWPLFPDKMRVVPSSAIGKLIDYYEFQGGSNVAKYEPEQVIHYKYPDPSNILIGVSPLKAAMRKIQIDIEQDNWNYHSLFNRFEPSVILGLKDELQAHQAETLTEKLKQRYSGSKNAKKPLPMQGLDNVYKISGTNAEMDFIKGKQVNREEICLAFGVPPVLVGLADNASLNNVREYEKVFWMHTLLPKLTAFAETLTWAFRDELGEGNYIYFDTKHIPALQPNFTEVVTQASTLAYMGVDLGEINRRLDMGLNLDNAQIKPKEPVSNNNQNA